MNTGFKIRPLAITLDKNRVGMDRVSPSLFPRFIREEVVFESMAPPWLINGIRSVILAYVPTKRLHVLRETYDASDQSIMPEFMMASVECIMCHANAPVNAKYVYSAMSGPNAIMMLQAANFKEVIDTHAIKGAFDGSILIGHMTVNSKIRFEAIVVEEPAYKSPVKPIEKDMVFYPMAAKDMYESSDNADDVFEARTSIDKPPYFVRFIGHGYGPTYAPLHAALSIISRYLQSWKTALINATSSAGDVIRVTNRSESGLIEHTWTVDEPLDHVASILRGVLIGHPKKYLSVIMVQDHIISTTAFRLVFAGNIDELRADLIDRIDETLAIVAKFNVPDGR